MTVAFCPYCRIGVDWEQIRASRCNNCGTATASNDFEFLEDYAEDQERPKMPPKTSAVAGDWFTDARGKRVVVLATFNP